MKRRICVVTGSRAEYGLLKLVMAGIEASDQLELRTIVTGSHLSAEFGSTFREVEEDGFPIHKKVEMLLSSDTPQGIVKSMGLGLIGLADAFAELRPDVVVLLGDRFEILAAASAATLFGIPVAHIHGGEKTEGAYDDAIRHAVTKLSHLHFVAAEEYRHRVIQLGESPERIFLVGGLGVDAIRQASLLTKPELERSIGFSFGVQNLLVTFHPETLADACAEKQMEAMLAALSRRPEIRLIFTYPNADNDHRTIVRMIESYVSERPNCLAVRSLGQRNYLSCLQFIDGVVGNSSSGLLEVPTFRKGTINIGNRQQGRLRASSVIDCEADESAILAALDRLYSPQYQAALLNVVNPYGEGGAARRIVETFETVSLRGLCGKSFVDLGAK